MKKVKKPKIVVVEKMCYWRWNPLIYAIGFFGCLASGIILTLSAIVPVWNVRLIEKLTGEPDEKSMFWKRFIFEEKNGTMIEKEKYFMEYRWE